ncbi:MAG: alpha/beta hydrolase [Rhodanobacteraceae bacterium]
MNRLAGVVLSLIAIGGMGIGMAATQHARATTNAPDAEIGSLQGASYRIDVPANWKHRLIVFFHGTSPAPVVFSAKDALSPMFEPMLRRGYAVIQSGYSQGGWAIQRAALDTERLRRFFIAHHGAPKQSFVMGMSMGGTLTAMTIEHQPDVYAGALSLCGAIGPSDALMQQGFALRAAFDYYFPDVLGTLAPVPDSFRADAMTEARIAAALAAKPAATRALLHWYGAADTNNLAPVLASITEDIRRLQQRTHGNPVGNADLIYIGSGDDAALNDGVRRYRADASPAAWLARWYTPSGKLTRPMLAVHDTRDPLVPASSAFEYALAAQRAGHSDNFVQQYVNREGHCVFTPQEVGRAFAELIDWVDADKRPQPGKLE